MGTRPPTLPTARGRDSTEEPRADLPTLGHSKKAQSFKEPKDYIVKKTHLLTLQHWLNGGETAGNLSRAGEANKCH